MKKLIQVVVAVVSVLLAPLTLAAFVETYTPGGINPASYTVLPGDTPDAVYSNITNAQNAGLGTLAANAGHEVVYLGLHTAFEATESGIAATDQVFVNLNNTGSGATGSVSLVLSAATGIEWLINVGAGVQLENVYVFSPNATDRANTTTSISGSSVIASVSAANVCGFELPSTGSCLTEDILGLPDETGFSFNNFLGDMAPGLSVTNFNGTYYVSQFDVNIDPVVIPLPAAGGLFAAALFCLQTLSSRGRK